MCNSVPKTWESENFNISVYRTWAIEMQAAMGDKIVETLYSNRVATENKRIHTPPVAQHCMEGMGEGKLSFTLWKSVKRQKAPKQGEVSQLISNREKAKT